MISFRERYYCPNKPAQKCDIQEGDVILLNVEKPNRENWPLGRVLKLNKDQDGIIRSVLVKTSKGEYLRSLDKIVPMEVRSKNDIIVNNSIPLPQEPVIKLTRPRRQAAARAEEVRRQMIKHDLI